MPPAEPPRHCPLPVCMVFAPHCRGRMQAARETPPLPSLHGLHGVYPALQIVVYGRFPRKPRAMAHPCREAYMPPLQTPGIASMTPGTGGGGRFTGRMHAAPTNRPGTAGKWQNRCLPQTSAAGVNARPTGRRKRPYSPQPPRGRKPPPGVLFTPWASAPLCRPCRGAAPRGWSRCRRPGGDSPKMR